MKDLGREFKNTLEKLSALKLELMEERPMSNAVAEALTNGESDRNASHVTQRTARLLSEYVTAASGALWDGHTIGEEALGRLGMLLTEMRADLGDVER